MRVNALIVSHLLLDFCLLVSEKLLLSCSEKLKDGLFCKDFLKRLLSLLTPASSIFYQEWPALQLQSENLNIIKASFGIVTIICKQNFFMGEDMNTVQYCTVFVVKSFPHLGHYRGQPVQSSVDQPYPGTTTSQDLGICLPSNH